MSETKLVRLERARKCDFCGKGQDAVRVLIVAPGDVADICDECVGVCVEVLASRQPAPPPHKESRDDGCSLAQ